MTSTTHGLERTVDTAGSESNNSGPKKPYHKPTLKVYGDIQTLTQAGVGKGQFDGGAGGMIKTA